MEMTVLLLSTHSIIVTINITHSEYHYFKLLECHHRMHEIQISEARYEELSSPSKITHTSNFSQRQLN